MIVMRDERSKIILKILCEDLNPKGKSMIEIGSYSGESTAIFAKYFEFVWAIDPWEIGMHITVGTSLDGANYYMEDYVETSFDIVQKQHPNIIKIKDYDKNVANEFVDNSIDFIYIDALHTEGEVAAQLKRWLPKIKRTGTIGGHDYTNAFPGVIVAVNSIIGYPDKIYSDNGCSWTKRVYIEI